MSFEEQFDEAIKKAMVDVAGLQEAFICEQLRDNFDFDENTQTATIKSYVKVRLIELEDYKQKVRDAIDKCREKVKQAYEAEYGGSNTSEFDELEKELGL